MDPLKRTLETSFEDARERITSALAGQGFGVLTRIDVKETLKKKIDVDFRRYEILGACNPRLAYEALTLDLQVGTLLPCNVVVYEDDEGHAVVQAVDPHSIIPGDSPEVKRIADEARDRLAKAIAAA